MIGSPLVQSVRRIRPSPRLGLWMGAVALCWLAVVGVQMLRGWPGWTVSFPLEPHEIRPEPKANGVWKVPVPRDHRGWLADKRGILLENGERAGRRSPSISGVLKESGGIFVVHSAFVRWRTADGSDPRKSGHAYELEVPARLPLWTAWAGLGLLVWGWSARRPEEPAPPGCGPLGRWTCPRRDVVIALLLIVVTTACGLSRIGDFEQTNDGVMMIKGLPYSDAACWYEMSVSLAEGRGLASAFDGQRPWYSVMIAMVHLWRGLAVENGLVVNALALGLASGVLYVIGRFLHSRMAGLGAAGVLMLSQQHWNSAAALLTETGGRALTALSIALILAAVSHAPAGRPRVCWAGGLLLGGLFQALGNLTCPYTLSAAPFYGLLLLHEGRRMTTTWRTWRVLQPALIYGAGFLLALGPWIARQHRVHGLATISTQTAELLYGATFNEGPLRPRQMEELHNHQRKAGYSAVEKYRFSLKRFGETVRADPAHYLKRLGAGALAFFGYFNVSSPEPAAAALLVVLAVIWQRRREPGRLAWTVAGAVVLTGAVWMLRLPSKVAGPWPLLSLTLLSALTAYFLGPKAGRTAVLWVISTLAGCMLINALTGNLIASRCWIFCDWCLWLLVLAAVHGTHDRLGCALAAMMRCPSARIAGPQDFAGIRRFTAALTALVLLAQLIGGALLLYRQTRPPTFHVKPMAEDLARVKAWAATELAGSAPPGEALHFHWVRLGEGACFLEANEEATLFSRAFLRQPARRTLRLVRGFPSVPGYAPPGWMVRLPGDARNLPEELPGLLVSWMSVDMKANLAQDEEILEGLAFLPSDAAGRVDVTRAILLTPGN